MMRRALVLVLSVVTGCDTIAGIDDLPPDEDRDGVEDQNDRCLGFDDRIDEDGDGVPDACDNCPDVANVDQANADADAGDQAGDACDPDVAPTCAVHVRRMFDGFNRDTFDAWAANAGTWTIGGGAMVQTALDEIAFAHVPTLRLANAVVRVTARITATVDTNDERGVLAGMAMTPGGTQAGTGYLCYAIARGSTHVLQLRRRESFSESTLETENVSGLFTIGGTLTVVGVSSSVDGTRICDATQRDPAAAAVEPARRQDSVFNAPGEMMVLTRRTAAEFLSVDVLEITGPCP